MGIYSQKARDDEKAAKSRASSVRVHYKQCREIMTTIRGMRLFKAKRFLRDVLAYKQAVPFTKYTGAIGRHAQGKNMKAPGAKCRWPQKASKAILDLLVNAQANAEANSLDVHSLIVSHCQANRAPKYRRRTYRAHGRINAYMASPAHLEIILEAPKEDVEKAPKKVTGVSNRRRARIAEKGGC